MIEPEPSMPHAGGDDLTAARSTPWSALRARLSRWRGRGSARSAPAPEIVYAFLAQRLVREMSQLDGGSLVVLSRVCAAPLAADTALLLARALATESGGGVLLVDADFEDAGLSRRFGRADAGGLCDLLVGAQVSPAALLIETAVAGVRLLAHGDRTLLPGALARERVTALLAALRPLAGHILLVQSPLGDDARNVPLAAAADGVVIVAEEAASRLAEIEQCEAILAASGVDDAKLVLARRRAAPGRAWPWQV